MQRREFLTFLAAATASGGVAWPSALQAQDQASSKQSAGDQIGQVATLQGSATVTRGNPAAAAGLRVNDSIFKNDTLETGTNSTLGVTFDDETTFSLSANTRIAVDEFVYQQDGSASANAALFTVARGTAAFLANKVASTGDMKIATPIATMGIRGTTGVVDVPETGTAGEPKIKLYPDAEGRARLRCAAEPAAAWRRSRFRFRRRKCCATAAYCSGSLPPTQSVSIRRSNAGNRASATGNGGTSCGGPAVLESSKTFAASRAGDRPASRTRPVRSGRRRASPIRPGRNGGSRFRIRERTYAARSAPIGSANGPLSHFRCDFNFGHFAGLRSLTSWAKALNRCATLRRAVCLRVRRPWVAIIDSRVAVLS
jgi:hypothetical protein